MATDRKRILCVDGDSDTCELLAVYLGVEQYEAKGAAGVREAIRLATSEHFDLFIIEQSYADGTGLALCKLLRSYAPNSPVIFFVNDPYELTCEEALAAGAYERLTKTGELERLGRIVRQALRQSDGD